MRVINIMSCENGDLLSVQYQGVMPFLPRIGERIRIESSSYRVKEIVHDFDVNAVFVYVEPI